MINIQTFTFNAFQENTYVLFDQTRECVIIDPGCYDNQEQRILSDFIEQNQLKPVKLLNTHSHVDHILGNRFVADKFKLKLAMNEHDLAGLRRTVDYGRVYGFQVDESPEPEEFLNEGDEVLFGESRLEVLFTPGHSPGSITFYNQLQNFIISGDVLFLQSIGRTDLPGGHHQTLIESIKNKLFVLGEKCTVYPGHGPSTSIGYEKINNPFLS
jgi:hydroxyacylglutathione hydrolase